MRFTGSDCWVANSLYLEVRIGLLSLWIKLIIIESPVMCDELSGMIGKTVLPDLI